MSFGITLIVCYVIFQIFFEINTVSGRSMNPTFEDGDIEFSVKSNFTDLQRGDIVNINSEYLGEGIIKRIIAVGGDTVKIQNGIVFLNCRELSEGYIKEPTNGDMEEVTVPKGSVFVMGDNRNNSLDSRVIGCVSEAEIESKVLIHIKK